MHILKPLMERSYQAPEKEEDDLHEQEEDIFHYLTMMWTIR